MIKRGDMFLAKLGPTQGSKTDREHAVVVMSRNAINKTSSIVVVGPVVARGTRKTEFPSNVVLKAGEGSFAEEFLALGEQVRSIGTARFAKQLGHLAPHSITAIRHRTKHCSRLVVFAF